MSPDHLCAMKAPCGQTTRDRGPPVSDLWPGRTELPGKARSVKTEEAGTQKPAASSPSPREPAGGGAPRTQLGDAPHAGGQEGLLQGPELQLRVGIGALVLAQGPAVVGAEVRGQREDTCGETRQKVTSGKQSEALGRAGSVAEVKAPLGDSRLSPWTALQGQGEEWPACRWH